MLLSRTGAPVALPADLFDEAALKTALIDKAPYPEGIETLFTLLYSSLPSQCRYAEATATEFGYDNKELAWGTAL